MVDAVKPFVSSHTEPSDQFFVGATLDAVSIDGEKLDMTMFAKFVPDDACTLYFRVS